MKRVTKLSAMFVVALAFVMVFASIVTPEPVSAETTYSDASVAANYPARTIRIKLLYDESYERLSNELKLTNAQIESRILQITTITSIPYKQAFNIKLEFTLQTYKSLIGARC